MEPYIHRVKYYETDTMKVTHHSNYVRIMEEARIDYMEKLGFAYDKLEESGIISPVTSINCQYRKTTTFPDELKVWITPIKCSGAIMRLAYRITKDDELVFTAESENCFLDSEGKLVNIKKAVPLFYEALKKEESQDK